MNLFSIFTAPLAQSALELSLVDICLRLLCAMVVGAVIGMEREHTHRPAGLRTHILVALGACSVMVTSQLIFTQYSACGASPDPARLAAQVITGVGFLGAGTILREGSNVTGLTTAASLWTVACLGIAAGGGYYAVALTGMVFILVTLTLFEMLQHGIHRTPPAPDHYTAEVSDITAGLQALNAAAQRHHIGLQEMTAQPLPEDGYRITFRGTSNGLNRKKHREDFFRELAADPVLRLLKCGEEQATHL